MANAELIAFNAAGQLMRVRNRLGTDLTGATPVTADDMAAIRATLAATATAIQLGVLNVLDYGAVGDGTTDDTAAISAAIAAAAAGSTKTVLFPAGSYRTTNFTAASGVTLQFPRGSSLKVDSGATATINATIDAGDYEIFLGAGTIAIGSRPKPEWWGMASQAELQFDNGTDLDVGTNTVSVVWTPTHGAISWTLTPRVRATLIDPANIEGNMASAWVSVDRAAGRFDLNVNMLVPVTLTGDAVWHLEVIGMV
jgi:hypothetical protein